MMTFSKINAASVATYGIYTAIFLIFALVPFVGFISIPPVKATLMALPVALVTLDKKFKGAIFGCVMFGLTSLLAATVYGSVFVVAPYNWGWAILILFLSRLLILVPLLPILIVCEVYWSKLKSTFKGLIYGLTIAIANTLLVILMLYLVNICGVITNAAMKNGYWAFLILVAKNFAIEWTLPPFLAMSLAPMMSHISLRANHHQNAHWT